ncbi:Purine ribonucleoside efflux pump NepI [Pseudoalteromonas haloplanktis]|uniref:Purine ribonucleoside efflux pump NepI n=1 Tax=Pseudoalteromonas haloplanktis TaxID=228 RepID=A0A9W4VLZ0_PSEHA|nr:MFS transporter [Pseudoalteromonas haloplanktis]CAH9050532.1 Purine ribonucleoside efflux pump NepI [Pseudoalteromonas haloplanktis]|tara:strand:- start:233 stop:1456 length:1224 start_codon:yes stop_codon:yes gene_type:complete
MNSKVERVDSELNLEQRQNKTEPAYWSGIFSMTLCVFALVASEFMPVSLLTLISSSLDVTEGMAGQGIAISGAFAVVTSLFISTLAGNVNRKTLLLVLTGMMGLSGAIIGIAPNYTIYMVGRAIIGAVIGGFWSMSAATAMRLVPENKVSRALAIFNSGNALAMVIAAPLGAYLGTLIGWRGAFLALIPVSIIALVWQWLSLPSMPVEKRTMNLRSVFSIFYLFRRPVVVVGMIAVGIFFMGQFSLYTYIRPYLENVTHTDPTTLSMTLMIMGVTGFIGTTIINNPLKHGFYTTLVTIPLIMAAISISLVMWGHLEGLVIALLAIWGFVATSAPVGWWAWVPKTFPNSAEAGGGLMVAVVQLSIALGSTVGGILYDVSGYESTFLSSAILLLIAAAMTLLTARMTVK